MKTATDPYTGFGTDTSSARRRLSIASMCTSTTKPSLCDQPTEVLNSEGSLLCGCGCQQLYGTCSGYLGLCQALYI
ncbi:hypothetical protein BDF14DRAFT_1749244 [Spinellus fusiger]|nr:hypothetical protein BDF14DRAFT_1749244 [Spinellus fusiger]